MCLEDILDVVLMESEVVKEYRSFQKKGMVFKADFEKAYDYGEWDFLDMVYNKTSLSQSGVGLI